MNCWIANQQVQGSRQATQYVVSCLEEEVGEMEGYLATSSGLGNIGRGEKPMYELVALKWIA